MEQADQGFTVLKDQAVQPNITIANRNRTEDISIAELRALEQFKDIQDEEATAIIKWIKEYTEIVYSVVVKTAQPAAVISMEESQTKNKAA